MLNLHGTSTASHPGAETVHTVTTHTPSKLAAVIAVVAVCGAIVAAARLVRRTLFR